MTANGANPNSLSSLGRIAILILGLCLLSTLPGPAAAENGAAPDARQAEPRTQKNAVKTTKGVLIKLDGTSLILGVGDGGGREVIVPTDERTKVTVNGEAAKLSDLKQGMAISIKQVDGLTTLIDARPGRR